MSIARPTVLAAALAAVAVLAPARSADAEVTVTQRLSKQVHTVLAGSGPVVDEYSETFELEDLAAPYARTVGYAAYVYNDRFNPEGEARAEAVSTLEDSLTFGAGGLLQARSVATIDGLAEHLWGGGLGQVSTHDAFSIRFTVTEPTDIVIAGEMNPTVGDFAEIRLQKVGTLFPRFSFLSLAGDSGPYEHVDTLEPGEYALGADVFLYILRTSATDPPFSTESAGYSMTITFGDGPDPCPADLSGDGDVGTDDLISVLASWGTCDGCAADLDGDGIVGLSDLIVLLSAWGSCGG